jgi:hypothetical protein
MSHLFDRGFAQARRKCPGNSEKRCGNSKKWLEIACLAPAEPAIRAHAPDRGAENRCVAPRAACSFFVPLPGDPGVRA